MSVEPFDESTELSRNEISDITSLGKLTQLSALYLSGNRISKASAIQNLHELSSLYLDGNKVSDLKPLAISETSRPWISPEIKFLTCLLFPI